MKIGNNKVISLTYELYLNDEKGELVQKIDKDRPFVYLFGVDSLLPSFEQNLEGKIVGDEFAFGLTSDEAYGPYEQEAIIPLDKKIFEVDGKIDEKLVQVGKVVPMQNDQGQPLNGIIIELTEDKVTMNFNHPLSGKNLHFKGEIIKVREATKKELENGHAH